MNKKGQAAMEFLMTYGWAILVVIAAISALAYFGVLDPARLLPERCQFPAGMDCIDKAAIDSTGSTVTVALRNNVGNSINITDVITTGTICTPSGKEAKPASGNWEDLDSVEVTVDNNEVVNIRINCTETLSSGDKFEEDMTVSYENLESGLPNKALGTIRGRVA